MRISSIVLIRQFVNLYTLTVFSDVEDGGVNFEYRYVWSNVV